MSKTKKYILYTLALVLLFAGGSLVLTSSATTIQEGPNMEYGLHQDLNSEYSFRAPVGWNIDERPEKRFPIVSLKNYDSDGVAGMDKGQQHFKIEIVKLPNENNLSLDDWVEQLMVSSPSSPIVVDTEEIDIAGLRGIYQLEKVQDFTHPVVYVKKGDSVYLINASRNYDKFEYVLEELIKSFEFNL